jgi:hypothetical protein
MPRDAKNLLDKLDESGLPEEWGDEDVYNALESVFPHGVAASPAVPSPQPSMSFSLGEAKALLAFFGGHNADISVQEMTAMTLPNGNTTPAGKYAWCTDYPEEGSQWLGEQDFDTEEHDTKVPTPDSTLAECMRIVEEVKFINPKTRDGVAWNYALDAALHHLSVIAKESKT